MSYIPKYTSEVKVEEVVQFEISTETSPNSSEVLNMIERVEKEIDGKKLGWKDGGSYGDGYDATNLYIDVTPENADIVTEDSTTYAKKVYLRGYPILSVISLKRRTSDELDDIPEWEDLTQGYYSGWSETSDTDYMLIKSRGKDNQEYGIGFYFYSDKKPKAGKARLKATFIYSYNVPQTVLEEYATLKVAIQVLRVAAVAGEPTRLSTYTGGDFQTFVNKEILQQIAEWEKRIAEIERDHFPDVPCGPVSF
jgi:hypothetical protein